MKELIRATQRLGRLQTLVARKDGSILAVAKERLYEAPFFLGTNPPQNDVIMVSAAAAPSVAMRAAAEGPMQIVELGAVRNATHKASKIILKLQDGQGAVDLMNAPCHIDTIFGPGGDMYPLPESLYLDENRALTATFIDTSAIPVVSKARDAGNNVTLVTSEPHGILPGDTIIVTLNPADATMDGTYVVTAVPTTASLVYTAAGAIVGTTVTGGTVGIGANAAAIANRARIVGSAAKYSKVVLDPTLSKIKQRLQSSQYMSCPYWYTIDDGTLDLTGLQTIEKEIAIAGNFHFEVHQLSVRSTGRFDIDIIDLTKGESIINAPSNSHYAIPDRLLFGDNSYPYQFEEAPLIFAGQRLLLRIQDTSGVANSINLALGGVHVRVANWS